MKNLREFEDNDWSEDDRRLREMFCVVFFPKQEIEWTDPPDPANFDPVL